MMPHSFFEGEAQFLESLLCSEEASSFDGRLFRASIMQQSFHLSRTLQSYVEYGTVPMRTAR